MNRHPDDIARIAALEAEVARLQPYDPEPTPEQIEADRQRAIRALTNLRPWELVSRGIFGKQTMGRSEAGNEDSVVVVAIGREGRPSEWQIHVSEDEDAPPAIWGRADTLADAMKDADQAAVQLLADLLAESDEDEPSDP